MKDERDDENEEEKVLQSVVNEKFECFRQLESERQYFFLLLKAPNSACFHIYLCRRFSNTLPQWFLLHNRHRRQLWGWSWQQFVSVSEYPREWHDLLFIHFYHEWLSRILQWAQLGSSLWLLNKLHNVCNSNEKRIKILFVISWRQFLDWISGKAVIISSNILYFLQCA